MDRRPGRQRPRTPRCMGRGPRRAVVAVAAAILLASCLPLPPPPPPPVATYCASSTPSTPAGFQAAFDNLRLTYTEWASADGAIPVSLPDGRVLWLFGDTFIGRVNGDGTIPPALPTVHNTFVLQSGQCFSPLMGGAAHARSSEIPDPAPDQWYWPASGVVDGGVLRLFVWHMQRAPSGAPGLGFTTLGMEVVSYSLPGLALLGVQALPFPAGSAGAPPYGATALAAPDGHVYVYGAGQGYAYVARTTVGQVPAGPWEFFNGSTWSVTAAAAAPMSWINIPPHYPAFGAGPGPVAEPWVVPYKTGYLATAFAVDAFSNQIYGFTGPTPAGPWTYLPDVMAYTPLHLPAYGALTRVDLPGTTTPVLIYSVNSTVFSSGPTSIGLYGPRFADPAWLP